MTETTQTSSTDVMAFFPLEKARRSQEIVIREIDKVFKSGKRIVILEAPVGSGKSAIAMTLAAAYGSAHVITPRKSLQDQYHDDFSDKLVLMKGRNAYPCTMDATPTRYNAVAKSIEAGKSVIPIYGEDTCANGPCKGNTDIYKLCTEDRPCPYSLAISVASGASTIVHNIHSFIFQTSFGGKFDKRPLLIMDECHELEGAIRDFTTKKITLNKPVLKEDLPKDEVKDWETFLLSDTLVPAEDPVEAAPWDEANVDEDGQEVKPKTERDKYIEQVQGVLASLEMMGGFVTKFTEVTNIKGVHTQTTLEFIPKSLNGSAERLIFEYGEKVLLMSGTIYDHAQFCRNAGIDPTQAQFIRIPSSFPAVNRPIYCKPKYQVDTSHRNWKDNFEEMTGIIENILGIFKDVKGLIHAPSYYAAQEIVVGMKNPRLVTHDKNNLIATLDAFYRDPRPQVLVSPVCQQGVDFKDDRARFQIITRVPYLNTSDEFASFKVENDFQWYNYQALVVFGQQVGRVNRSESDFGATFLLDSRFNSFISKNSRKLPKWLTEAIIHR